ncbi:hypothetical protein Scep_015582 [Stephania cephalantha]|uniref:Ferritin n=1 Tax=Stephania cephalantha TaxID=152367 RepID=A0AAP0J5W2_9MAGN
MSLKLISALSPSSTQKILNFRFLHRKQGSGCHGLSSLDLRFLTRKQSNAFRVSSEMESNIRPIQGLDWFDPLEELKTSEAFLVPSDPHQSLCRQSYADECEKAVNEQINVEYNISYIYHAMYAYFNRDNVALKGLAKFFEKSSEEEREHALKLMRYQTMRGGKVELYSIVAPQHEYDRAKKGDALYAMELALSLEKLVNMKLQQLQNVAVKNRDVQLVDFVESEFLRMQVESIEKISKYVAQLRGVGKGHGTWHFDQMLLKEGAAA